MKLTMVSYPFKSGILINWTKKNDAHTECVNIFFICGIVAGKLCVTMHIDAINRVFSPERYRWLRGTGQYLALNMKTP